MKKYRKLAFSLLFFNLILAAGSFGQSLSHVASFAYQLQGINAAQLKASPYDLMVIDYSSDGTQKKAFSRETILDIIAGKANRKVIAYLSIGEAEDYRYYFQKAWIRTDKRRICKASNTSSAPEWLEKANADFCGNYKTRFWLRSWQKIIYGVSSGKNKSYLDRIIDAGFQGVYLDIIDGFEYWQFDKPQSQRRKTAAVDMAKFVERISNYARKTRNLPDFIVIPQNGAGIISNLSIAAKQRYFQAIDGIGAEDTFYFGDQDANNSLDPQVEVISTLQQFAAAGKKVFAIDYLTDQAKIDDFKSRACELGFIPQVSNRALDSFSSQKLNACK